MAINKNSNAFTFGFAIAMVVIVGVTLATVSMGLKERQLKNKADKQKVDILGAIGVESTRATAGDMFAEYVNERISIDHKGNVQKSVTGEINPSDKEDPFNIDVLKDYRSKEAAETTFPLYKCTVDGKTLYVVPMAGTGLWGPIWGYVALNDDYTTISGAKFDHQGETPGLGAEIKGEAFQKKLFGKKVNNGSKKTFEVVKSGLPTNESSVDGITGGTITSVGVGEMLDRSFKIYALYFQTL